MLKRLLFLAPVAAILTGVTFVAMQKFINFSVPLAVVAKEASAVTLLTYDEAMRLLPRQNYCRTHTRCEIPKDRTPLSAKQIIARQGSAPPPPDIDWLETREWGVSGEPEGPLPACDFSDPSAFPPMMLFPPQYPELANKRQIEGWVLVRFDVTKDGITENIQIVESEPGRIFAGSVLAAVKKWTVYPNCLTSGFKGVKGVEQRIDFALD